MAASVEADLDLLDEPSSPLISDNDDDNNNVEESSCVHYIPPPEGLAPDDDSVCRLGVTLAVLDKLCALVAELESKRRAEAPDEPALPLTTSDVSQLIVLPLTEGKQCSLLDLLLDDDSALLRQWGGAVGRANVFVSHAWRYEFSKLVDSIRNFAEELGDAFSPDTTFFWVDVVVNSQWNCAARPFEWWSTTFRENIRSIGHTLLVLSPWNAPIPLTRAWCLYELLSTAVTRSRLSIQLPRTERIAFETALADNFEEVMSALANIDAERSEAWNPQDKEMIFAAVRSYEGGFHELNSAVLELLRLWLTTTATKAVEARSGGGGAEAADLGSARLLDGLAKLHYSLGSFAKARSCQEAALAIKRTLLGDSHEEVFNSTTWLAVVTWRLGDVQQALSLHRSCLAWRSEHLGAEHPQTLQSAGFVANSLNALRQFADAEACYRANLELQKRVLGLEHVDTLYSYAWLAVVLQNQKKYEEAAAIHASCYDIRCRLIGPRHYDTLFSLNNLAVVREKLRMYSEAAELHRQCFTVRHQTLGALHTSTVSSLNSLLRILLQQRSFADAEALLRPYQQRADLDHAPAAVFVGKGLVAVCRLRQRKNDDGLLQQALDCLQSKLGLTAKHPYVRQLAQAARSRHGARDSPRPVDSPRSKRGGDRSKRGAVARGQSAPKKPLRQSDGFEQRGRAAKTRGGARGGRAAGPGFRTSANNFALLNNSDGDEPYDDDDEQLLQATQTDE